MSRLNQQLKNQLGVGSQKTVELDSMRELQEQLDKLISPGKKDIPPTYYFRLLLVLIKHYSVYLGPFFNFKYALSINLLKFICPS